MSRSSRPVVRLVRLVRRSACGLCAGNVVVVAGMTLGEGAITLDELVAEDHEKLALVFGSEGFGITARTDALLDRRVTIPMWR